MTLRLYFSTDTAGYSPPSWLTGWEKTTGAVTRKLGPKVGAVTSVANTETSTSSTYDLALGRFISDPFLTGGTLTTDTLRIINAYNTTSSSAFRSRISVYVTAGDTDTVRGTWAAEKIGSTNWSSTEPTRQGWSEFAPDATVNAQAGDRLVIELGARAVNTTSASRSATLYYGGSSAQSDHPETGTGDTSAAPWVDLTGADLEGLWTPPPDTASLFALFADA